MAAPATSRGTGTLGLAPRGLAPRGLATPGLATAASAVGLLRLLVEGVGLLDERLLVGHLGGHDAVDVVE